MEDKYKAQKKHLKENYVKFSLNLKPDVITAFKQACEQNGTKPTTEIKKFIADYCEQTKSE